MRQTERVLSRTAAKVVILVLIGSCAVGAAQQVEFDPGPILEQNRAWLHPNIEHLRSVSFVHRIEPLGVEERFAWRHDGVSQVEVLEWPWGAEVLGRQWVTTAAPGLYLFAPGSTYAANESLPEGGLARYLRNHLMGVHANFLTLDWGWAPESFTVRSVSRDESGRLVVQLVPHDPVYCINAGAMFHAGSSAYVHDVRVGWGELVVDPVSRRILREVDYSLEGKKICEIELLEWHAIDSGREVPLRIHLRFPYRDNFDVDYRFQWRDEGLWILANGTSQFEEQEPLREENCELAVNQPVPQLDAALARLEQGSQRLQAAETPPTIIRLNGVHRFELGKNVALTVPASEKPSPLQSLLFTFPDNASESRWAGLVAEMVLAAPRPQAESPGELLLTLLDKSGRPMQVHRVPWAALLNAERKPTELIQAVRDHNAAWLIPTQENALQLSYTFTAGSKSQEFSVGESAGRDDRRCGLALSTDWSGFATAPERFHAPVQFAGKLDGREVIVAGVVESGNLRWSHGLERVGHRGGYHSESLGQGLLVVDKESWRPLVSCYGDTEIQFLDYVELQPGVSAPLRIVIFSQGQRDDFRFQILDGRVWLFDRSFSDGKLRTALEKISLEGRPAQVTAKTPADALPADQLARFDWSRITDRRVLRSAEPAVIQEIIACTRPSDHPSYKPLLTTKLTFAEGTSESPLRLEIGGSVFLKEIGFWTLAWLVPDSPPQPFPGPETLEVPAYPWKCEERLAVNVSSKKQESGSEGIRTQINAYTLTQDPTGLHANVEILSRDENREISSPVTVALADNDGRLLAAGSEGVRFTIHNGVYSCDKTLHFSRVQGFAPAHVLLGLQAVVTAMPMGSKWGYFGHEGPLFSYEQLLGGEDPRVWGHGVRSLFADLQRKGLDRDDVGDWWDEHDAERKALLAPHLDQLQRLLQVAGDPESLALVARLAGHSGDLRFCPDLAKLLEHPQSQVQDVAAVALGLLGDPRGLARLRPILQRPMPADEKDYQARRSVESSQIDAALALAGIGTEQALRTLGDQLLETVGQLREEPTQRGTGLAGPVEVAEILIHVLGSTKNPIIVDYFGRVLQSNIGPRLAHFICPHLARLEDKGSVREIFLAGIRRGEASFIGNAPSDPALACAIAEIILRPGLDENAFWSSMRYLGASDMAEATEALRQAFDKGLFRESARMRSELAEALANRGDYRGLSEMFERLVAAVDPSTLPEEAQARKKEEGERRGRVRDLGRLITGEFPVSVVAEFLRPRQNADQSAVRDAVAQIVEQSPKLEAALTTSPPQFPESVVQLGHVDNTAEGMQSYGGTGFGVKFTRPDNATYVVAVEFYGSRYGEPHPPADDFHIYFLDENQKVIRDVACPYARVARGQETWYTIATPPTEVPREFWIGLWFNANQHKGIYLYKDTAVTESHSYTGTPETGYQLVGDKFDWMVRVRLAPKDIAEVVAKELAATPELPTIPAPLLAPAADQERGHEVLKQLAEVNRYWLSRPPSAVHSYSYMYHLDGSPAKKIEVDAATSADGAARQGVSYYSAIHHFIRDPARVRFRRVEVTQEKITLGYMLAEPAPVAVGTGISGSWRGYLGTSVREGTLVIDAKRLVPLEHSADGLREIYSEYVELDAGHFAPLRIDIGTQFAWAFCVYEPGLWLFAHAADVGSGAPGKWIASVNEVRINGQEGTIKYAPQQ